MNNLIPTHVYGNTYSFSDDPEHLAKMRKSAKAEEDFDTAVKEMIDELELDVEDEYLMMYIARIVEATNGTMPFTICTLCGNTDDWHYNNNAECS